MTAGVACLAASTAVAFTGYGTEHFVGGLILLGVGLELPVHRRQHPDSPTTYRRAERFKAQGFNDLIVFGTMAAMTWRPGCCWSSWAGGDCCCARCRSSSRCWRCSASCPVRPDRSPRRADRSAGRRIRGGGPRTLGTLGKGSAAIAQATGCMPPNPAPNDLLAGFRDENPHKHTAGRQSAVPRDASPVRATMGSRSHRASAVPTTCRYRYRVSGG